MASSLSDEDSLDSDLEIFDSNSRLSCDIHFTNNADGHFAMDYNKPNSNIVNKIVNRQIFGKINRYSKSSTDRIFTDIYYKCRYRLASVIPREAVSHVFMGFTLCSKYFVSYTTRLGEPSNGATVFPSIEYELHIWRFVPGQKLQYISKHRIFKLFKSSLGLDDIMFMQFPTDPYKIICYAATTGNPAMAFLTVLTLPAKNCRNCLPRHHGLSDQFTEGWCFKHGFILHFMFTISHPEPIFDPHISMAYPDHIVINTGHCVHILNFATIEPVKNVVIFSQEYENKPTVCNCTDSLSEVSESPSDICSSTNSIVDAILEDFGEYDLEGNDHSKPFHELNISCDPLNVTGKTYHNTLIHNIVDTRLKHIHNSGPKDCLFSVPQSSGLQKQLEKSKIDKKIAEKTYEFTEENEKCEKLSLFRKKRLADKKYEFSEDNSENIVPFYSLRREKRCLHRSQNHCLKSPEFKSLFLSPRSPGLRSPMQSPNSRSGQFSPGGGRNLYCTVIRTNSNFSKSPISPKESARKINVYSPSLDSDCSDSESRLILRPVQNGFTSSYSCDSKMSSQHSLLIIDGKQNETPKWIKKVVKRYSNVDFENSSLLSGQSRDDYNVPIEIPVLVQGLSEQNLDIIPEAKADQVFETQLIITQRTLDCDQFVQSRAQKLCLDAHLEFLHCEDYDIKILHVCPFNGHIICKAVIAIGALEDLVPYVKRNVYVAEFIFSWNIVDNEFDVIEPPEKLKLQTKWTGAKLPLIKVPSMVHRKVLVMEHVYSESKSSLRDYNNCYEICINGENAISSADEFDEFSIPSDSDLGF